MTTYIGLLRKDPDSDFGVDFPDFPGCVTAGSTLEEARRMAVEALTGHIEAMQEVGEPILSPSSIETIMTDPENAEAIPFPVTVPDRLTGAGQVDVTLSAGDLKKLDALAEKRGSSRSELLAEAARRLVREAEEHHAA